MIDRKPTSKHVSHAMQRVWAVRRINQLHSAIRAGAPVDAALRAAWRWGYEQGQRAMRKEKR